MGLNSCVRILFFFTWRRLSKTSRRRGGARKSWALAFAIVQKIQVSFLCFNLHCLSYRPSACYTRRLFKSLTFTGYSSSTRELDRAARKDLNEERRRSKLAEQERKSRETEKAERLAKQRELAKTLAATLRYTPSAWNNYSHCTYAQCPTLVS